ncbi:hypothetical protein [Nonomuraea endophytica]|uniref:Uncharacterized protein n=1 Tax=Nonomuraea endophytica TaxID=714136 RepID=A0A7W8A5B4_9ACTN|nr:hypothetical protein [Nonomuraea endophytica]MBB5078996.1 hypothetical protein [Nonomuraea endophytica]
MRKLLPVLVVCALAGCASPDTGPQAATPAPTPSTPTTSASATESPSREPTTKVKACFDGDCLLKLSKPVTIRLNAKKFYYPKLEVVAIDKDTITYWVEYPHGGGVEQRLGEGGGSSFAFRENTPVEVKLVSITKGQALLSLSPGERG